MGCAQGSSGQLFLNDSADFTSSPEAFEFRSETFKMTEDVGHGDFIRGLVGQSDGLKRVVRKTVSGGSPPILVPSMPTGSLGGRWAMPQAPPTHQQTQPPRFGRPSTASPTG